MRIAYLGTSPFAATVLRALADTPHRPALVVTRPDRPRGRGRRLAAPPVAEAAHELGLALTQPADVNAADARAEIAAAAPEALVVCAFGALIREALLADHEILNVHPSLLPRWRGAAPIERAIMAGDAQTGVSIMRLTAGLDSGPVALAAAEPITETDTYGTLAARLEILGADLLRRALDAGPGGLSRREQDEAEVTYAEKITPADRLLQATEDAEGLARRVRALTPHIGATLVLPGEDGDDRLGVRAVRARPARPGDPGPGELGPAAPDAIPALGCAQATTLELLEAQPAGGRAMDGGAWLRGHPLSRR